MIEALCGVKHTWESLSIYLMHVIPPCPATYLVLFVFLQMYIVCHFMCTLYYPLPVHEVGITFHLIHEETEVL